MRNQIVTLVSTPESEMNIEIVCFGREVGVTRLLHVGKLSR